MAPLSILTVGVTREQMAESLRAREEFVTLAPFGIL
jgi:hypothetical protein